jgi:hypothetical protein
VVGTVAAPAPARIRSVEEEKEEESREGRVPAVRDLPASPHRSTVQAVPPYRPAVQTTPLPSPTATTLELERRGMLYPPDLASEEAAAPPKGSRRRGCTAHGSKVDVPAPPLTNRTCGAQDSPPPLTSWTTTALLDPPCCPVAWIRRSSIGCLGLELGRRACQHQRRDCLRIEPGPPLVQTPPGARRRRRLGLGSAGRGTRDWEGTVGGR